MSDDQMIEHQRSASYLLPDPGGEVVRELLDEIARLRAECEQWSNSVDLLMGQVDRLRDDIKTITSNRDYWRRTHKRELDRAIYAEKRIAELENEVNGLAHELAVVSSNREYWRKTYKRLCERQGVNDE